MSWLLLLACNGPDSPGPVSDDSPVTDDSGADTDDSDPVEDCFIVPDTISPKDGAREVYSRQDLSVQFTGEVSTASFRLRATHGEASGELEASRPGVDDGADDFQPHEVELTVDWNASREIATLEHDGMGANTRYALDITVCGQTYTSTFSTDVYGDPLDITDEELVDNTFVVELSEVTFTEPAGFGSFLSVYLDVPILIGVVSIDGDSMDMLGAQGRLTSDGRYVQKKRQTLEDGEKYTVPTWDFPGVDYSQAPFWAGESELIELRYDGTLIPVHNFHVEGTFAPDGRSFGGGRIWGLGDTRHMAEIFNSDDANYVCGLVETAGASCEPCPDDGEPYCLFLKGEDIEAERERSLVLEPQEFMLWEDWEAQQE